MVRASARAREPAPPEPLRSEAVPIRRALLAWYGEHGRDLPWRVDADPYRVWLSEVMLQQTRVDTVRERFRQWLDRFPTLDSVAVADLDSVLRAWEGLGYYARARNFHRAAREVRERYGGEVPGDPEAFGALPGVGRYTAGAVLSIAFGRPQPVVDGNVRRVIARWLDAPDPPAPELWRCAEALVEADGGADPGALNQALMELGATVCTPRRPGCDSCPVRRWCGAAAAGTQDERPRPRRRAPLPLRRYASVIVAHEDRLLLRQRPEDGLLGGMWEFPEAALNGGGGAVEAVAASVAAELLGVAAEPRAIGTVRHTFSHFRAEYTAVHLHPSRPPVVSVLPERYRWVAAAGLRDLALSRAQRRIAALLEI